MIAWVSLLPCASMLTIRGGASEPMRCPVGYTEAPRSVCQDYASGSSGVKVWREGPSFPFWNYLGVSTVSRLHSGCMVMRNAVQQLVGFSWAQPTFGIETGCLPQTECLCVSIMELKVDDFLLPSDLCLGNIDSPDPTCSVCVALGSCEHVSFIGQQCLFVSRPFLAAFVRGKCFGANGVEVAGRSCFDVVPLLDSVLDVFEHSGGIALSAASHSGTSPPLDSMQWVLPVKSGHTFALEAYHETTQIYINASLMYTVRPCSNDTETPPPLPPTPVSPAPNAPPPSSAPPSPPPDGDELCKLDFLCPSLPGNCDSAMAGSDGNILVEFIYMTQTASSVFEGTLSAYTCGVYARPDMFLECADIAAPSTLYGRFGASGGDVVVRPNEGGNFFGQRHTCNSSSFGSRIVGDGVVDSLDVALLLAVHHGTSPFQTADGILQRTVHRQGRGVGGQCGAIIRWNDYHRYFYGVNDVNGVAGMCTHCDVAEFCAPRMEMTSANIQRIVSKAVWIPQYLTPVLPTRGLSFMTSFMPVHGWSMDPLTITMDAADRAPRGRWFSLNVVGFHYAVQLLLVGVKEGGVRKVLFDSERREAALASEDDVTIRHLEYANRQCVIETSTPPFGIRHGVIGYRQVPDASGTICNFKFFIYIPYTLFENTTCIGIEAGSVSINGLRGGLVRKRVCTTSDNDDDDDKSDTPSPPPFPPPFPLPIPLALPPPSGSASEPTFSLPGPLRLSGGMVLAVVGVAACRYFFRRRPEEPHGPS